MSGQPLRVAVVGCGPWGLAVLERLHATASRAVGRQRLIVHIVEPETPGVGVYSTRLPEYLLLNTVCGQIDLFASKILNPELNRSAPRPSFYEWLLAEGYRIEDSASAGDTALRPVRRSDFLPRRWLGEYLHAVFQMLVRSAPPNLQLHVHRQRALRVQERADAERLWLEDGTQLELDYVFLTLGHGESPAAQSEARQLGAHGEPTAWESASAEPGARIGLSGFGLTAIDTLAHATLGRGGRYVRRAGQLHYLPSGREPLLFQFSRSGMPYKTRPHGSGEVERDVLSPVVDAECKRQLLLRRGSLDFRSDLLPIVLARMQERFANASGPSARRFDPSRLLFEAQPTFNDAAAYEAALSRSVRRDLHDSRLGISDSPSKAALESLRGLRELIRELADFGGLSVDSFVDFRRAFVPQVYRSIVGPPTQKMEEWLALRRAGVLSAPFGPGARVSERPQGWRIESTTLARQSTVDARHVLAGFAPPAHSPLQRSALLANLLTEGRARLLDASATLGCGLKLDRAFHPIGRAGTARRLFVLGLLSEGSRSFNLYVPSPGSRFRAFSDMQACIDDMLQRAPHWSETATSHIDCSRQ